jgi:hypothetical protein
VENVGRMTAGEARLDLAAVVPPGGHSWRRPSPAGPHRGRRAFCRSWLKRSRLVSRARLLVSRWTSVSTWVGRRGRRLPRCRLSKPRASAILCRPQVESESSRSLRELGVFGHELGTTEPSARPIQLGLESFHRDCKVEHRRGSDQGGLIRAAAGFVV